MQTIHNHFSDQFAVDLFVHGDETVKSDRVWITLDAVTTLNTLTRTLCAFTLACSARPERPDHRITLVVKVPYGVTILHGFSCVSFTLLGIECRTVPT